MRHLNPLKHPLVRIGWVAALLGLAGCAASGTITATTTTQTDRLMQFYDDLRSGRFVVIADFENEHHMELVELIADSDAARCTLDRRRGRRETGRSALRFRFGSDLDAVVVSNANANNWYLKRDWRAFDMLLFNVFSPRTQLVADVTIVAGNGETHTALNTQVALDKGWNLIRLDLADVGERLPLDDVRQWRLSILGADGSDIAYVDDLILARNRQTLFGDATNIGQAMYVERIGRRWSVGAGGRFELVFSNGQIVGWYDLVSDPHRRRNLVAGSVLGPTPVMPRDETEQWDRASGGRALRVHPKILEMNRVRVVVACDWTLFDRDRPDEASLETRRWKYTIYPTGQVYVTVDYSGAPEGGEATVPSLVVALTATSDDAVQTHTSGGDGSPPSLGLIRSEPSTYSVLFTPTRPCRLRAIQSRNGDGRKEVTLVATAADAADVDSRWVCQLHLASGTALDEQQAHDRALGFAHPPTPAMQVGSLASSRAAEDDATGFDPDSGSYLLLPDAGVCRFHIGAKDRPVYAPAFTILGSAERKVWVYVDHILLEDTARDSNGNYLFQLPQTLSQPTLVEILIRAPDTGDDA